MLWPFKRRPLPPPSDVGQARLMRAETEVQQQQLDERGPAVRQMSKYLAERRRQNHFGEAIKITFTPRAQ